MAFAAGSLCSLMSLRHGAMVMALLQFILSAIFTIALWVEVTKWGTNEGARITGTTAAAATYYTILCFSALIGSFAIITRSKEILKYFAFCLGWSLGIHIAVSALQLWGFLSTSRSTLLANCVLVPGMTTSSCNRAFALSIGWLIASIIVGLLLQLCSAYVVSLYSSKLSSEDKWTERAPLPNISAPQPAAAAPVPVLLHRPASQVIAQANSEPYGKEKEWAASSRESLDSSDGDDDDGAHVRFDPGPPRPPMLEPAPPKRIPRVSPRLLSNNNSPRSTDAQTIANATAVTARENPFADASLDVPPGLNRPPAAVLSDRAPSVTLNLDLKPGTNPFIADPATIV